MSEEKDTCKQALPISGLLKFSNLHFEEGALSMLSLHLPALVYLEFDYCTFVDGIQTTQSNVNMPNTTITTLKIDMGTISKVKAVLISVCSLEKRISQYYYHVVQDYDPTSQITKFKYDHFLEVIDCRNCLKVTISTKAIKRIFLTTYDNGSRDIAITLP